MNIWAWLRPLPQSGMDFGKDWIFPEPAVFTELKDSANRITCGTSSFGVRGASIVRELYYSAAGDVDETAIRSGKLCEFRGSDVVPASTSTDPVKLCRTSAKLLSRRYTREFALKCMAMFKSVPARAGFGMCIYICFPVL